jgi:lysine 6-dehydrogenase
MKKITILGCGMVGRAMALDLCRDYQITAVDRDETNLSLLKDEIIHHKKRADLSVESEIQNAIADAGLVIGALPGFMGFEAMKTVIRNGKNIVDIAFYPEDPFELDALAKEHQVTAVMDCGIAPGMSNMILGYHNKQMTVDNFVCLVGGLPKKRVWPYEYKAPFSPIDVLEEYIRPARIVENGNIVTKPALSEPEHVDFDTVGTLEAFNTDGLRSLIKTMKIPNMIEKTMRYPGHALFMKALRETGFLNKDPITVQGKDIVPLDFTSSLLFPLWKLGDNEPEFTVMRITLTGQENGTKTKLVYNMYDQFDQETGISSMARTTGYTCTAVARLVIEGEYNQIGISPPEYIGARSACFQKVQDYLEERNIHFQFEKETIS